MGARSTFHRVAGRAKSAVLGLTRPSPDDQYVTTSPAPQRALDIFKGERRPKFAARFEPARETETAGFAHAVHRFHYRSTRFGLGFSGGVASYSHWLTRDTILGALRTFGFDRIDTAFDEPDHPNGPAFALVATRRGG